MHGHNSNAYIYLSIREVHLNQKVRVVMSAFCLETVISMPV